MDSLKKNQSLAHRTLTGMMWLMSSAVVKVVLQLFVLAVMARLISPEEYGLIGAAMIVIGFSMLFTSMGIGSALVQRTDLDQNHIHTGFTLSIIIGLLFTMIIFWASPLIALFFRMPELEPILQVLSLIFLVQALSIVPQSLIQREMRFKWLAIREVVAYVVGYAIIGLTMAMMGMGVWALVGAHMGQAVFSTLILLTGQPHSKKIRIHWKSFKEIINYGGGLTLATFFNKIALQGDNFIVGRWLGAQALGFYGRSYQLMAMPAGLIGEVISKTLFPAMAKIQRDTDRLQTIHRRGVLLIGLLCMPFSAFIYVMAPEIINIMLGSNWQEVIMPLQILCFATFFRVGYKVNNTLALATGYVYNLSWRYAVNALLIVTGSYVGHYFGITGVAFGVLFALFCFYLLMTNLGIKISHISTKEIFVAHLPGLVLGLIVYAVIATFAAFARSYFLNDVFIFIIALILLLCTFILFWLYPPFVGSNDKSWAENVLRKYIPKRDNYA